VSESKITFTNWDQTPSRSTGGKQVARGTRSPVATDLHIEFEKGGVDVKHEGKEAIKVGHDTKKNSYTLTFPGDKPINSSPYVSPAKLQPNGTVFPAPEALPGTSTTVTFKHTDGVFPPVKEWYWTFRGERCSSVFRGDPDAGVEIVPKKAR
jgi:hypothetical protein